MKIAISGPVGSGKSTLAAALSARFGLEVLPENMDGIVTAQRRLAVAGNANWRERAIQQKNALRAWMKAHEEWFEARARAVRQAKACVTDRSDLDVLASWLVFFSGQPDNGATARLMAGMAERLKPFDLIVLLPPRADASAATNETGLKRELSPVAHWLHYCLAQGLAAESGTPLLVLDAKGSVAARVEAIAARLDETTP